MISFGQVSHTRHDQSIHQLLTNSLSKMKKCSYVETRVTLIITNETQHYSSKTTVDFILISDEVNSNMTSLLTSQWYQHAQKIFFETKRFTNQLIASALLVSNQWLQLCAYQFEASTPSPPPVTYEQVTVVYVRGWGIGTLPGWVGNLNRKCFYLLTWRC